MKASYTPITIQSWAFWNIGGFLNYSLGEQIVYISIVTKELMKIAESKPVSYFAIRKRIAAHKQRVRIKELRSHFATYLRQHGILAEYADLLQGRIPKSIFAKYYPKIESVRALV